ncbi:VOC family protein [soil metagenome]
MQSPKLAQVAFVVADMDAAIARWRAALGLPEPHVVVTDPGSAVRMDYRGIPSDAKAKLAFFDLGGVQLELIQPIGEDSAWAEGLRDREGFHHLAFWTEDMEVESSQLAGCEIHQAQRGDMGEGQYAYYDAGGALGAWIELLQHKRPEGS